MQNADYVEQRNALISSAVAYANRIAGANPLSNADRDVWNRAFHSKMNDLARTTSVCSRTNNQREIKGAA